MFICYARFSEEVVSANNGETRVKSQIKFEACKEEVVVFKAVQEMWGDFLPLLMDAESLISQYKGR